MPLTSRSISRGRLQPLVGHRNTHTRRPTAGGVYVAVALALSAALAWTLFACASLAVASAATTEGSQYGSIGQYGEVTRFGGFDSTWFDNGKYDGNGGSPVETEPAAGKFLNPVGFAVDTKDTTPGGDGTAIYVLDRVSAYPAKVSASQPGTEWRLQKLSDTGTVLATSEFYLPKTVIAEAKYSVFVGVTGLAVDDTTGRIYTILYGSTGEEEETTQYAEEILAWSTTPVDGKLVAPGASGSYPALPEETAVTKEVSGSGYTHPGLLSSSTQLASKTIYDPQGLALDVTGGEDYLAIDGNERLRSSSGTVQGPAVVEQVSTASGAETASWSTSSLSSVTNASTADTKATAAGISTNSDGSLDVLLSTGSAQLDAVDLQSSLGDPEVISSSAIDPASGAAGVPLQTSNAASASATNPAPQVVGLSNGLYAADFYVNTGGVGYWERATNEGIRLVEPETGGLLSNPLAPATSIFDTLGNATAGDACYIGDEAVANGANGVSLAAGANGTIWVLTAGKDSSGYGSGSDAAYITGRQVIELQPGAANPCAGPSQTTFSVTAGSTTQQASTSTPLVVTVGSTVEFDAATIGYPTTTGKPASVFAYEWDPTGASSGGPGNNGYTIINDTETSDLHPSQTASYQYTTPGVYTAKLKLLGDFGEYNESGIIEVQTTSPPTAAFNVEPSTVQTGQAVSFNAEGSQPANDAQIADYHWSFGDGQTDDTQSATDSHTYTESGTYTVTLTVRDNDERSSAPVTQQVTVTSPPQTNGTGGSNSGSQNTGSQTTQTTNTTTAKTQTTKVKTLTTAQRLAQALEACKRKPKRQRSACERQARKRYASKHSPPKSKKRKTKSKKR